MLEFTVAVTEEYVEVGVSLVREQVFLARVDVEGRFGDLLTSIEEVEFPFVQTATHVRACTNNK